MCNAQRSVREPATRGHTVCESPGVKRPEQAHRRDRKCQQKGLSSMPGEQEGKGQRAGPSGGVLAAVGGLAPLGVDQSPRFRERGECVCVARGLCCERAPCGGPLGPSDSSSLGAPGPPRRELWGASSGSVLTPARALGSCSSCPSTILRRRQNCAAGLRDSQACPSAPTSRRV